MESLFITNRMQACCNGSIVNYYFIIINVRRPAPHYTTALSAQLCPWPVWIVWDQLRLQYVSSCRPVLTGSSTCWRQTIHRHVSHLSVVCDSVSFILSVLLQYYKSPVTLLNVCV